MKQFFILLLLCISLSLMAQDIELPKPKKEGGMPLMQAFTERMTNRVYQSTELSLEELSQLVWVANGINRPDGKRTIPTARNRQEVEILVLLSSGSYLYNPQKHILIQKQKKIYDPMLVLFQLLYILYLSQIQQNVAQNHVPFLLHV